MFAAACIAILIVGICISDVGWRWWRQNEGRRRWRTPPADPDDW